MVVMFLKSELGFPSFLTYTIDIINCILLLFCIKKKRINNQRWLWLYVGVLIAYAMLGAVAFDVPILLFLWGVRSNFRFYVFFIACCTFLKKSDYIKIMNKFDILLVINAAVCTAQFFILGYGRDNVGGLFGSASGCNAYMNCFLIIVIAYDVVGYIRKKIPLSKLMVSVACAIYISIVSELKIFLVEMVLIFAIASLLTKFSIRKIGMTLLVILSVASLTMLLPRFYPQWEGQLGLNGLIVNITRDSGYTGEGDLNRLNAIIKIKSEFDDRTLIGSLFGSGLGSWEYSDSFDFLTSNNYAKYSATHYQWISYAWIYLEMGFVGLGIIVSFFVLVIYHSRRIKAKTEYEKILHNTAFITTIMCFILIIYNVSLRMEAAYLIYFVMAAPFVIGKENKTNQIILNNN